MRDILVHAVSDVSKGISRQGLNFKAINRRAETCKQSAMSSKPKFEMQLPDKSSEVNIVFTRCLRNQSSSKA